MMRTLPPQPAGENTFDPRHGHDGLPVEEEEFA
jgi:hypothetical protein